MEELIQMQDQDIDEAQGESYVSARRKVGKAFFESKIELGIEIGSLEMSINDFIELAPGASFSYSFEAEKPLALMLGEEKLAEGRFVEHEGKLLLQIEKVFD